MFFKIGGFKNIAIFTGNQLEACNFIKSDSNTGVFYEICNIFKNTLFNRAPPVVTCESASESHQIWYRKDMLHSFLEA